MKARGQGVALFPPGPTALPATTRRTSPSLRMAHLEGDLIYLNNSPRKRGGSGKRRPIVSIGTLRLRGAVTQPLSGLCWEGERRATAPALPQALRQGPTLPADSGVPPTGGVSEEGSQCGGGQR